MKYIILSRGYKSLVDDEDFDFLNQWKWHASCTSTIYAIRNPLVPSPNCSCGCTKKLVVFLHRLIMNAPKNLSIDHINGDSLDNRKSNLRLCTRSQNCQNRAKLKKPTLSIYKGVQPWFKKWRVIVRKKHVGMFKTEIEAAKAYDKKAKELFGEFARTNF